MLFFSTTPTHSSRPEVHGHRGCRGLLPENTLPAFLHALALGVDVLELDVVISQDQQVVVSHEPWLSARLGPGPNGEPIDPRHEREYNLYHLPYATIRRCVVGEQPHPGFPMQQRTATYRPLLREVLQATEATCQRLGRSPVGYSIELKSMPDGDDIFHPRPAWFVELVLSELVAAAVLLRTTLLSFDARILQAARQLSPALALCLLSEDHTPAEILFHQLGFVPETFGPNFQLLSQRTVTDLATRYPAIRLIPWTINTPSDMQQAITWGVAGITTDYPDRLLQLLA
ncbi:glycerophosphodiester phosphodiesterase family protein [Hymenobacter sp. H14-R3]|uniref:glycerophosphodiester phosphodiesterase family protein n=1 Tax=Hymenobacter sp. H14-R3 TaxID=3046308 RepID=UPI0024B9996F|nr:glycerophosphodiester phosphodiesterase family protein [Hymenobacter sp. H14-R3]MDJ0364447.1 glycerophosphodiester phosphodiesterase family protein [Hymenobacter sp. H14-R3]